MIYMQEKAALCKKKHKENQHLQEKEKEKRNITNNNRATKPNHPLDIF